MNPDERDRCVICPMCGDALPYVPVVTTRLHGWRCARCRKIVVLQPDGTEAVLDALPLRRS